MNIVILAAGKSTRMRSQKPKVLHNLAGKPILAHVLQTVRVMKARQVVIVCGKNKKELQSLVSEDSILWAEQPEPTGTGSAASIGLNLIENDDPCLVLCADMPLISVLTLQKIATSHTEQKADLTILTELSDNPSCYGRIIRDNNGKVAEIIEEKDATDEEKKISEINCGIYYCRTTILRCWLRSLEAHNSQGEYYLTDIVKKAVAEGKIINTASPESKYEIHGINNAQQLEHAERIVQKVRANQLLSQGIRLADASRIDIRGNLTCEEDVFIDTNCIFIGDVHLGKNVSIGPNCYIRDSTIGDNSEVLPNSVIEGASVGKNTAIGPFARIRPITSVHDNTKIGNFVEIKNSCVNNGTKINHLSYIGDSTLCNDVLIGAGTITCNFDGTRKNHTHIGEHSFIGSGTQLIAPLRLGSYVTIGAGSTITKDVPNNSLAISRSQQKNIPRKTCKEAQEECEKSDIDKEDAK